MTFQEKIEVHYYISSDVEINLALQVEFKLDLMVHNNIDDFREFNDLYESACVSASTHKDIAREFREKLIWALLEWDDCVGSMPKTVFLEEV